MDEITENNQAKWDELARKGVLYSRPLLDLTPDSAREWLDPYQMLDDLTGKNVLCLAGGGGKQSAAFGCLGANVFVLDISSEMLARDRLAADNYGYPVEIRQGDMRDLSGYTDGQFDIVFQPYSLNYVPDPAPVFRGVARILKSGGLYVVELGSPFSLGLFETDWDGQGYPVRLPYINGAEIENPIWTFEDDQGGEVKMPGPRTFRHTLGAVINTLVTLGFHLVRLEEESMGDPEAEPGTWDHFKNRLPPWMTMWFIKR